MGLVFVWVVFQEGLHQNVKLVFDSLIYLPQFVDFLLSFFNPLNVLLTIVNFIPAFPESSRKLFDLFKGLRRELLCDLLNIPSSVGLAHSNVVKEIFFAPIGKPLLKQPIL